MIVSIPLKCLALAASCVVAVALISMLRYQREDPLSFPQLGSLRSQFLEWKPRGPPEGSLFTWEAIVDEPADTIFNETFASYINDYHHPENCSVTFGMDSFIKALSIWTQVAKEEKIPYFLAYGTLLGYARNKEIIPYDHDVDIMVPSWAYDRLLKYVTPLPSIPNKNQFMLHLHPEFRHVASVNRRRYQCDGRVVQRQLDRCSYQAPMGRLIFGYRHVDLFALDHFPQYNVVAGLDDPFTVITKLDMLFPLRPCTLSGLPVLCPNDYITVLHAARGPHIEYMRPNHLCINGEFKSYSKDEQFHDQYLKEWKGKFGPAVTDSVVDTSSIWNETMTAASFCDSLDPPLDWEGYGICMFPETK